MSRKKQKIKRESANPILLKKRRLLVGDAHFSPTSYLELGHFWNYLDTRELIKGEEYGQLRALSLKSQERRVLWTHRTPGLPCYSWEMSPRQMEHVEKIWMKLIKSLTIRDMSLLDWLVHGAIGYDMPSDVVRKQIVNACVALRKL